MTRHTVSRILLTLVFFALASSLPARTWTDQTGRTLEGEWVTSDARQITLRLSSGKTVTFSLSKLSSEDREYAKKRALEERHPAGWKPLRIHLDHMGDAPRAVGMPGAFHRVSSRVCEADGSIGGGEALTTHFEGAYQST